MKQIVFKNKKNIAVLSLFLILIILYTGLYLPLRKKFLNLQKGWKGYEKILIGTGLVDSLSSRSKLEKTAVSLANRLQRLEGLFPHQDSDTIDNISRLAYKLNIELVSISPTKKEPAFDENKKEIYVGKRKLEKAKINLSLRTNFRNLVKYIEELKNLPYLINFEKIVLSKAQASAVESDRLKVELEIAVFTLAPFAI